MRISDWSSDVCSSDLRKTHLYGAYERRLFTPGTPQSDLRDFDGVRLGFLICYDVEFPENVRRLARAGAELILVPTALPQGHFAAFIATSVVPVRAFENQVFVVYEIGSTSCRERVCQYGEHSVVAVSLKNKKIK